MMSFELLISDKHFILRPDPDGEAISLWINRSSCLLQLKDSSELPGECNLKCHGVVYGLIGRIDVHTDLCPRLVFIRDCSGVAPAPTRKENQYPALMDCVAEKHEIYKIEDVISIPVTTDELDLCGLNLKTCLKHQMNEKLDLSGSQKDDSQSLLNDSIKDGSKGSAFRNKIRDIASDTLKSTSDSASAIVNQVKQSKLATSLNISDSGGIVVPSDFIPSSSESLSNMTNSVRLALLRFEVRIIEEIYRMFTQSSFYFTQSSSEYCITRSCQIQSDSDHQIEKNDQDRYFFNFSMLRDLFDIDDRRKNVFVIKCIQGFVERLTFDLSLFDDSSAMMLSCEDKRVDLFLISRRSRFRAGSRYKRRGVDKHGNVANFVETEQILKYHHYTLSYVMTRGSIPLYWSQSGLQYRPPPLSFGSDEENKQAFAAHFTDMCEQYAPPTVVINLANQRSREKEICEAYLKHAVHLNTEALSYIAFDFQNQCRGMKYGNVSRLVDTLADLLCIRDMRYCWLDRQGRVCKQRGVLRFNCIDCLDRTNVAQSAVAKNVLLSQLTKLGFMQPGDDLNHEVASQFQRMWADNGDALSRQYAGTNALKGDFTRAGVTLSTSSSVSSKAASKSLLLSGLVKDGVNSANRYYLNQFKDAFRQVTIDLVIGDLESPELIEMYDNIEKMKTTAANNASEQSSVLSVVPDETDERRVAQIPSVVLSCEQVEQIVEDCKCLFISDNDLIIGIWILLIDNKSGATNNVLDIILILTKCSILLVTFDLSSDCITSCETLNLQSLEKVKVKSDSIVLECSSNSSRSSKEVRLRASQFTIFNNVVHQLAPSKTKEEDSEGVDNRLTEHENLIILSDSIHNAVKSTQLDSSHSVEHPQNLVIEISNEDSVYSTGQSVSPPKLLTSIVNNKISNKIKSFGKMKLFNVQSSKAVGGDQDNPPPDASPSSNNDITHPYIVYSAANSDKSEEEQCHIQINEPSFDEQMFVNRKLSKRISKSDDSSMHNVGVAAEEENVMEDSTGNSGGKSPLATVAAAERLSRGFQSFVSSGTKRLKNMHELSPRLYGGQRKVMTVQNTEKNVLTDSKFYESTKTKVIII